MPGRLAPIALALYAISLLLPAVAVTEAPLLWGKSRDTTLLGFHCALFGFFYFPGWVANPLFFAAGICHGFRRHGAALILAVLAILSAVIALVMLAHDKHFALRYPHVGYCVWVASMVTLAIAALRARPATIER